MSATPNRPDAEPSEYLTSPLRRVLSPWADDVDAAVETTDDPRGATAYALLAAIARGRPVPPDVKRRFREHFNGGRPR